MKIIIKLGGAALGKQGHAAQVRSRHCGVGRRRPTEVTVVHGGGAALTRTLKLLGKESDFVNGLRITDAETRDVALMVLAGIVNKSLVAAIVAAGRPAIGLCGGDGMAFRARKKETPGYDLGYVEKSVRLNRAGWKLSGDWGEFQCCPRWRSVRTVNITT